MKKRTGVTGTLLGIGAVLLTADPASAHERWFVDRHYATDWSFAARPLSLALLSVMVVVTLVWRKVAMALPSPELAVLRPLSRLTPYVPRLIGIHLGVALLALAARGYFLSPSLELHDVPGSSFAAVVEGAVGVWLIIGIRVRGAALAVIAMGPALFLGAGPVALLENAALLGVAVFLLIAPPCDEAVHGRVDYPATRLLPALLALRIGAATTLVALAFSEKFSNPAMAHAVLDRYPTLNIFATIGLPVSDGSFIAIAGAIEVLFGLLVLSGALPQVAVIVAAVPFNLTLLLFGATELIGHLPVYGIFLTLLVYGSDPRTSRLVRSMTTPALHLDHADLNPPVYPAWNTALGREGATR